MCSLHCSGGRAAPSYPMRCAIKHCTIVLSVLVPESRHLHTCSWQGASMVTCCSQVSAMELGSPPKMARLSNDGSPPKAGRSAAAAAPTVQGSSPGAQKAAAAAWQRQQDAGTDAASVAAEVQADRFAKFTIVADPAPLWRSAVQELAEHAAQVRERPMLVTCIESR